MGSATAHIAVGHRHRYHGGIYPTHVAWLHENSRPGWVLEPTEQTRSQGNWALDHDEVVPWALEPVVWIPQRPETILEDGLVLIAMRVLWGKGEAADRAEALEVPDLAYAERVELEELAPKPLEELRAEARALDLDYKLVITVLVGSSLLAQVPILERYQCEAEVCTVSYSRLRGGFGGGGPLEARGSLEPPPGAGHRYHEINFN